MAVKNYVEEWYRKSEEASKRYTFMAIMFYLAFLAVYAILWLLQRDILLFVQGTSIITSLTLVNVLSTRSQAKKRREVVEVLRAATWMFNVDTSTCIGASKIERRRRLEKPLLGSRRYRLVCFGDEPIGIVDDEGNYVDVEDLAKQLKRIQIWR